jgi:hypothetical protein
MGTDITSFQVPLKKLRELCQKGSKHRVEILEKFKERLASLDESFHRGEEPARDLVSELLRGKYSNQWSAHKTAYVLEIICDYVGKRLNTDDLTFLMRPFENFYAFLEVWKLTQLPFAIENIGQGLFQPPIALLPPKDWPHIVTYEVEEVKVAHKAIELFHQEKGPVWKRFNQQAEALRQKPPESKALETWLKMTRFQAHCDRDATRGTEDLSMELNFMTAIPSRTNEEWEGHFEERVKDNFSDQEKYLPTIYELFEVIKEAAKAKEGIVMFAY